MSTFKYFVEPKPEEINFRADMFSLWASREYYKLDADKVAAQSIILAFIIPSLSDDLYWPTRSELKAIAPKQRLGTGWSE